MEDTLAKEVRIGSRPLGAGHPVYVIAEMSANHGRKYEHAEELVRAAAAAGADAVKLQTYTADTLTLDSDRDEFRIRGGLWDGRSLHELYREAAMPWDWQPHLARLARDLSIDLLSSAFDETALDFLEREVGVDAHKISSFELVDIPLLERAARSGKPVILSTGMATREEIEEAVGAIRSAGGEELVLLACNSAYPAPPEEMHLRNVVELRDAFGVVSGLSDHSLGNTVAIAAVALGACVIEKHFTLSREHDTPDAAFSIEPAELEALVRDIRTVEAAVGAPRFGGRGSESDSRRLRRSLFVVRDVEAGAEITAADVRSIRPADGLHPRHLREVVGRRAAAPIPRGTPLRFDLLE